MCDSMNIVLYHGERRRIALRVWMCNDAPFIITSPTWALYQNNLEDSGNCEPVSENDSRVWHLWCEIQPLQVGTYHLKFRYMIGTEIIIRNVNVEVIP